MKIVDLRFGRCSTFGGPHDRGLSPTEGLALVEEADLLGWWFGSLFLPADPLNPSGLARRLNPEAFYCALRWDYSQFSREQIRRSLILARREDKFCWLRPVDWGPARKTLRLIDISPGAARALGVKTDQDLALTLFVP